jgi:hypothetical protein
MKVLQKFYPHLLALLGFIAVSIIYFYPALQGKELYQSDIAQYTGMAKEQNDFRAAEHAEPYWTNSAFGGMPTYQLGANYPHDYIGKLDDLIRFLPRPADYLFLYFFGFYILLIVLKADPIKAFFGALAFGLSTYMIIILGVGHNAKAHAIGYMPLVVAGVLLVFRRRFILGGLLTMIAAALEINANHFQMTYYLLILLVIIGVFYAYKYIKNKDYKPLLAAFGVFAVAGLFAIGVNAANLMATAEYTDFSMRGKSELTFNPDGSTDNTKSAMKYDYITEYSYGIAESFNLIAPRLFGGSNSEDLGAESELYKYVLSQGAPPEQARQISSALPTYWGDQPIVAAPAYIGAVVFFLAMLALFADKRKIKYAFLAGAVLSLLLSWGKNFPALTNFFIDYVPLYDKFRAVSSIQVVLELCLPVLAVMGLQSFFTLRSNEDRATRQKDLLKSFGVAFGIITLLFLFKGAFDFSAARDIQFKDYGADFVAALKADRRSLYSADLLRSGTLIVLAAAVLYLFTKNRLTQNTAVILVGLIMVGDLFFIDKKYLNADNEGGHSAFISKLEAAQPFQPTEADLEILKDTSVYRVYEVQGRLQGRTSYFHKSVGGYSAVRPRRMDQLFDYVVDPNLSDIGKNINAETLSLAKSHPVLDALNVKYLILQTNEGQDVPIANHFANGNAWFVSEVNAVPTADAEMKAMAITNLKTTAIVNKNDATKGAAAIGKDSAATIKLIIHKPNYIKYSSKNSQNGLAVFSEIYYPKGWNVYVDGQKSDHFRADYTLRAMYIPAGKHTVEFRFEPQIIKTGGTIALVSSVGMLLLIGGGIYLNRQRIKESI